MYEHLYIHIPFCDNICFYCDFFKIKKTKGEMVEEFLVDFEKSVLEAKQNQKFNLKTIYIGGGTPNCLKDSELNLVLQLIKNNFDLTNLEEYTIELNPERITESQLLILKDNSINRLSIGVQTFDDELLKKLNRKHTVNQVEEGYKLARKVGFDNISFDLIYNLYGQEDHHIDNDLKMVKQLNPDHISWYSLVLKENSVWGKTKVKLPGNDVHYDEKINAFLQKLNYKRYEVSNYVLDNKKRSKHNICYWSNKAFFPIGPGATGFNNFDITNVFLIENSRSYANWSTKILPVEVKDYYFQIFMMGLRMVEGINLKEVKDGEKAFELYKANIMKQVDLGLLELKNSTLKCTTRGYEIINSVLVDIMLD